MKSTGNDIVALKLVDKERTNQFRFYSKILSASEQELYNQYQLKAFSFEHYVWLLWSVKESAYKYLKRLTPGLLFSPTKIIIQQIQPSVSPNKPVSNFIDDGISISQKNYCGKFTYNGQSLYFRSAINEEWIASMVSDTEDLDNVCWGVGRVVNSDNESRSAGARAMLLAQLNSRLPGVLHIEKSAVGYPVILQNGDVTGTVASLAHDGPFVGYAYLADSIPAADLPVI